MTVEVMKFWDSEFSDKIKELKTLIESTEKAKGVLKAQELRQIQEEVKKVVTNVRRTFRMELTNQSSEVQYSYSLRLEQYDKALDDIRNRIHVQEKCVLLNTDTIERNPEALLDTNQSRNILLTETEKIQGKAEESLINSLQKAREMNEVGSEALKNLESQTEQLGGIKEKVENMDSELKKAEVLMKGIVRRMMTDKLIVCFIGIIFFSIVGLVIYSQVKPEESQDTIFVPSP